MIWHASRRHTYIYIYMERVVSFSSPARSPLLLYCNDNSARDGGRDAVNIEYRCEVKKKKRKESLESLERGKIMERGRVLVVGTRRGNSRRERNSLLRGFGRAKSRVPKSLPPTLPRAGQSLQPDLFPRFRC